MSSSSLSILQLKSRTSVMELELGLKITRTPHDFSSGSDVWFARNRASPRFVSKETDTSIVLTGHMKGYRRENISIKINEHGTRIAISGEKPVQEMIMMGWIMLKKEVEIREFRKVFRIPEGVVLDRIKANYNQDGSILAIYFPKLIKGISGIVIEDEPEEETEGRIHEMDSSGIEDEIPLHEENDQISSVEETRQITEDNNIGERQAELIDKSIETMEKTHGYEEKVEENRIAGASSEQNDKDLVAEMEGREAAHEIIDASIAIPDLNYHQRETHEVIDEREGQGAEFATEEAENENDETQRQMERKQQKETENEEEQTQKIVQEQENDRQKGCEIQEKVEKKTWNPFVIAGSAFLASSLLVVVLGLKKKRLYALPGDSMTC